MERERMVVVAAGLALAAGCFGGGGGVTGGTGAGNGGMGAGNGGSGAGNGTLPFAGSSGGTNAVGGAGGSTAGASGGSGVDCTLIPCGFGACDDGFRPYTPPGACCPTHCEPSLDKCTAVDCAVPECPNGKLVTPEGQCCPVCMGGDGCAPACPTYDCPGPMVYDPATCCMVCGDTSACEGVKTCAMGADCGGAACCDTEGNYFDCYCGNISCSLNLRCSDGTSYGCSPPTQGAEPPVPPPDVCGCIPDCPDGYFVIVNATGQTWPDGTPRGSFTCSTTLPP
jgi:hypothetical protein